LIFQEEIQKLKERHRREKKAGDPSAEKVIDIVNVLYLKITHETISRCWGMIWAMVENMESCGISYFHFPGLESHTMLSRGFFEFSPLVREKKKPLLGRV